MSVCSVGDDVSAQPCLGWAFSFWSRERAGLPHKACRWTWQRSGSKICRKAGRQEDAMYVPMPRKPKLPMAGRNSPASQCIP